MVRSVTHGGDIHNNPGLHILSRSSPVSTSPRGWCHLADIPPDLTKSELELLRHFWNVIPAAWSSENSYWWYYRLLNSSLGMHALSWRYSRYAQPVVRNRQLFKSNFCGWPTVSNVAWSITAISKYSREILLFILFIGECVLQSAVEGAELVTRQKLQIHGTSNCRFLFRLKIFEGSWQWLSA